MLERPRAIPDPPLVPRRPQHVGHSGTRYFRYPEWPRTRETGNTPGLIHWAMTHRMTGESRLFVLSRRDFVTLIGSAGGWQLARAAGAIGSGITLSGSPKANSSRRRVAAALVAKAATATSRSCTLAAAGNPTCRIIGTSLLGQNIVLASL